MQWRGIIFDVIVALRHICFVECYQHGHSIAARAVTKGIAHAYFFCEIESLSAEKFPPF